MTLRVASGRVTPETVTALAVIRPLSAGELTIKVRVAEVDRADGAGVAVGKVVGGGKVGGEGVWPLGTVVGATDEGVGVGAIAGAVVATGVGEVAASSPPQAARNTSTAATGKRPSLVHRRPNTFTLISY